MILPKEQQVCSLKYAKKLKKLGVPQESLFEWWLNDFGEWVLEYAELLPSKDIEPERYCSAFTVAELGELLPFCKDEEKWLPFKTDVGDWLVWEHFNGLYDESGNYMREKNEANARAKMLIYLKENGSLLEHG